MSKLRGIEVVLALAMAAVLLISAASLGTIAISAQTLSSQSATSNNTTNVANSTATGRIDRGNNVAEEVDSGNDTTAMVASMHTICSQAASNSAGAARATEVSNNTANTGATNASDGTMQGRPNPTNIMNATADYNNAGSSQGGNLTTLSELLSQARIDLVKGCNAVNNGDGSSALTQLTSVARALDNIEGNLTSIMTGRGGNDSTTNAPPTGGTSASSVEGATTVEPSGP